MSTLPSQYEYLSHVRTKTTAVEEPAIPVPALYNDAGRLWKELVALNSGA